MNYSDLSCFSVEIREGVAFCVIDHPPLNLMDLEMVKDINRLARLLRDDERVKVIVFRSKDPEFFIAHADLNLLLHAQRSPYDPEKLNIVNHALQQFRNMPKVSIAQIEGRAFGGGSEFALAMDMRFAAMEGAVLGQPEVALGVTPGGGGCARLPELVGRSRALEILLGCQRFSAAEAERFGYINRALPAADLGAFVNALAKRIASYPLTAIAAVKAAIDDGSASAMEDRLIEEQRQFLRASGNAESTRRIEKALAIGFQRREVELAGIDTLLHQLEG